MQYIAKIAFCYSCGNEPFNKWHYFCAQMQFLFRSKRFIQDIHLFELSAEIGNFTFYN